ncbi:AbrB/MazE/SpoVT family DNA-binding domain-containing protein [Jeotgalibacillus proteolyticus]|uniref:Transition state regulator Abh n=1 Tax=Jeotgalibacillus proteolyticus TaxID=2082395 RepID=A0A2S5G6Z5_9BACL|nr:AbrB/MazE/SpoVT family DNA-binding domain-containing protein [Jeotgalibacillus proteolyticus]PPA68735.1 transition state regulator Abh [Jeotgalibacillus proteolyticus]
MKSTGVVKKIDPIGRITIPSKLRRAIDVELKDPVELYTEKDIIILKKYEPIHTCIITGEESEKNLKISDDVILSPKGASIILEEIRERF